MPLVNVTEYLEHLVLRAGFQRKTCHATSAHPSEADLGSARSWRRSLRELEKTIEELKREDGAFHMEGGSWTNDVSWVADYQGLLGPMEKVSALFSEKVLKAGIPSHDRRYRKALFHLLCSQTSCFRYWGHGTWTDYGHEIVRRAERILTDEL